MRFLRYVAFVSEATSAYLSVEAPPHHMALTLHAASNRCADTFCLYSTAQFGIP